jgi:hypothetical protein
VANLAAWLTTVTGRICLDMLRSRTARREESLDVHLPDPIISFDDDDPEQEALTRWPGALLFSRPGVSSRQALVNWAAGVLSWQDGRLVAVLGFTIAHGKIVAIDVLADPERLSGLEGVAG